MGGETYNIGNVSNRERLPRRSPTGSRFVFNPGRGLNFLTHYPMPKFLTSWQSNVRRSIAVSAAALLVTASVVYGATTIGTTIATDLTRVTTDTGSLQSVAGDLTLEGAAGSSTSASPKFQGGVMGNLHGDTLTATANYNGGVIGGYSVTTTDATTYPAGAVLGLVGMDGATSGADGAIVAVLDGDSGIVTGTAAFKFMNNNSTAGSGFSYGLDLYGAAHDGYLANDQMIDVADIRLQNQETISNETDGTIDFGAANLITTGQTTITGELNLGVVSTFVDADTTPDVTGAAYWNTNTTGVTITDFDGAGLSAGDVIVVVSKGAIVYDVTSSGIIGGSTDITTAASDVTTFIYDGTDWRVVARMDQSDDLN